MDGELEFLKIIAQLCIFLMSITVPTYAIAISYISRAAPQAAKEVKEKREKLEEELKKDIVREKLEVRAIEQKIKRFRNDEKAIIKGLERFSWKGVILYPSLFFGLALSCVAYGIFFYPDTSFYLSSWTVGCYIPAFLFIGVGIIFLGRAVVGIEKASRRGEALEETKEKNIKHSSEGDI